MRIKLLSAARLLLVLTLASAVYQVDPGAAQETESESSLVIAVEVPVQVTAGGQPVRGLRADQFEIYDGETKQVLTGFEVVDLGATSAAPPASVAAPLPASGRRHLLFLFDLAFSQPASFAKARVAALDVVDDALHPSDLAAVATYSLSRGVRIVLGFTSDREQLVAALQGLDSPQMFASGGDPLRLTLAVTAADVLNAQQQPPIGGEGPAAAAKAERREIRDAEKIDDAERMVFDAGRADRAQQVEKVRDLARSWTSLSRLLGTIEGRKYVILLSEGFDSRVLAGAPPDRFERESAESGEMWQVDSEARFGSNRAQNELQRLLEELRRADCVVHAVDIGGARTSADAGVGAVRVGGQGIEGVAATSPSGGADAGQDSLFVLARDTGGEMVRNFNDLGAALDRVLERTSVTYVLTFQPADPRADGAYHRLQVKLRGAPRGARLSHRSGYYAPRHFADRGAAERDFAAAQLLMTGGDSGALETAMLAVPLPRRPSVSPGADERADVAVVLDIPGGPLLAGHWGEDVPTQIYVYAVGERGGIGDHLAQHLNLDLAKMGDALAQGGVRFLGRLSLAPGRYSLRALVRNERSGAYALRSSDLVVPPFSSTILTVSTPLVPSFAGAWIPARSPRWATPPPFTLDARPFLPSPLALFRPGQQARFWMPALNLPGGKLVADLRLLAADGSVAATMPIAVERREAIGGFEPLLLTTGALASTIAEGSYQLTVEVRTADGRTVHSTPVPAYVLRAS